MHRTNVGPDDSISQMGSEIISESQVSDSDTQVPANEVEASLPVAEDHGKRSAKNSEEDSCKRQSSIIRRPRRSIFIGYSPDAGYLERKLVLEVVKQIKLNGLSECIWFDANESVTETCCNLAYTLEAVERCRAAVLFLSDSFFTTPLSLNVGQTLLERIRDREGSVSIFSVLVGPMNSEIVPEAPSPLFHRHIDLYDERLRDQSIAEKCTAVVGAYMIELERFASTLVPFLPEPFESCIQGRYKNSCLSKWTVGDLQDWLYDMGVREYYRQAFAEEMVDGFLLSCMTDEDLSKYASVESRIVRKKLTNQVLSLLDKEHKLLHNWHLRAKGAKIRPQTVYLIYDPSEARLGKSLRDDLTKKGLKVIHHNKLGQSKEEFLQFNATGLSTAAHVLLLLTDNSLTSPYVFHEVMFASWLNKRIITLLFKNGWHKLRPSLRAVLGETMSVDFESRRYADGMAVLVHLLKPSQTMPGIVLEQTYIDKMSESVQPLRKLVRLIVPTSLTSLVVEPRRQPEPTVFLSFQWDVMLKAEELRNALENVQLSCWSDLMDLQQVTAASLSPRANAGAMNIGGTESVQSQVQRNMKMTKVVVCLITSKYLHSETCAKDIALAELLRKPIIPLLVKFSLWPPETAPTIVKKLLSKAHALDISNDKLFRSNIPLLIERIRKIVSK